ncbi:MULTISPECIES: PQQ-dependent dehydrogenase, methanol/ethanol family [Pseudomonas]|uniref:PQQ-dependent dehydrogenase, methanol/ethanol family n=1 Tax=Pseudomonas TaxID=286 RepID=UPI0016482F5C|nr:MULTISPECIES: PQQ-dependent dehydrogenase, methanol/ethanol family [Pseudomonas]QXH87084.1 PQQ-dependent dehydrogenase, methanol/ethanol family [Pseudomonas shahriarae]WLI32485.1 PQQ-dependent dehydrogenase, methanol/ethanol family [Pseudomonas sp. FP818]
MNTRSLLLGTPLLLSAFATLALAGPAQVDGPRIIAADREPGNWMSHGRTYDEQRYSPLDRVNAGNVGQLGMAWTTKLDIDSGTEATPLVVDGVMYTTGAFSIVYAINAATGELLWKYDPKVPAENLGQGCCGPVNRGVAVWQGKVYVGSFDGRLIALDAGTGQPVWSVDTLIDRSKSYSITGAPRIVKGKVLIGNGGAEFGVRGYVTAYDADTGKQVWRFYTVPGDPKLPPENAAMAKAMKTWDGDGWVKWGGGGTVWDSMAYDPQLDLLYVGTGNGSPWNYQFRSNGKGDNLYVSSILALRPDTGEYVWHYQITPQDQWDFTATQHMILADIEMNGSVRKVIMQAPKNGFFYVLDRTNGKLLSAKNFVPVNWASGIDLQTGRPILTGAADYSKEPKVVQPSFLGGHNWHPMSYSPKTGYVYIPAQYTLAELKAAKVPQFLANKSVVNFGLDVPDLPEDPKVLNQIRDAWSGELIAWDPVKQKAAWKQPYVSAGNGGTLATAGNLVFQGTADGRVVAYRADTGQPLWEHRANSGVMAGPVTYTVNGEQYVAFSVGWGGILPLLTGPLTNKGKVRAESRVIAFKLGATGELPPPKAAPVLPTTRQVLTATPEQLVQARGMFNGLCAGCHGLNAISGGVVPDLRYLDDNKHAAFPAFVSGALINKGMPNFSDILQREDMELLRQYLVKRTRDLQADLNAIH